MKAWLEGPPLFRHETFVSLRDADAAGVLFFARHQALAHDAYEIFLTRNGMNPGKIIAEGRYALPIVHVEADYRAPLHCGDGVVIEMRVAEVRTRSFTLEFSLSNSEGALASRVRTTHASVSLATRKAVPLPEELVRALRPNDANPVCDS